MNARELPTCSMCGRELYDGSHVVSPTKYGLLLDRPAHDDCAREAADHADDGNRSMAAAWRNR